MVKCLNNDEGNGFSTKVKEIIYSHESLNHVRYNIRQIQEMLSAGSCCIAFLESLIVLSHYHLTLATLGRHPVETASEGIKMTLTSPESDFNIRRYLLKKDFKKVQLTFHLNV
jgi:hypothetical protein